MTQLANEPVHSSQYFDVEGAIAYLRQQHGLKTTSKTLAKLRSIGGGPRFRKVMGKIVHEPAWLDEWAASRMSPVVASTSELNCTA